MLTSALIIYGFQVSGVPPKADRWPGSGQFDQKSKLVCLLKMFKNVVGAVCPPGRKPYGLEATAMNSV
jgi:hypothetical protein